MSEQALMRMLKRLVQPSRILDIELRGKPDGPWAARLSFADHPDRWFKGEKKAWKEEVWFPGEDAERQHALP